MNGRLAVAWGREALHGLLGACATLARANGPLLQVFWALAGEGSHLLPAEILHRNLRGQVPHEPPVCGFAVLPLLAIVAPASSNRIRLRFLLQPLIN